LAKWRCGSIDAPLAQHPDSAGGLRFSRRDHAWVGLAEPLWCGRFNNAAAAPAGPLGATTRTEFDHLFAVNVRAPYFIIQRASPLLRDGDRIVTI
jgi:NAD(P)-dependent dehydrogenase (short-subunit alcohol dehydrogenase family)